MDRRPGPVFRRGRGLLRRECGSLRARRMPGFGRARNRPILLGTGCASWCARCGDGRTGMTVAMERPIMREKPFAWPAVLACFASAMIAWGFGFYGQSVFLASLQASQGWSTALIASATTAYYLCGAVLMTLTPDWIARWGSRVVILGGAAALAGGTLALTCATAPWQ